MNELQEISSLRDQTGVSIQECKRAIEYARTHDKCTPLGYLKAITYAVATRGVSFEEQVQRFSDEGGKNE